MSITYHERPGVYSDYEASSITATAAGSKVVAACGVSTAAAGLYTVTSYTSAATTFGEDSELGRMLVVDVVVLSIVVVTAKKFTELSPDWNIPVPNMRIMEKICCIK